MGDLPPVSRLTNRTSRWHILTGGYPPEPGGVADYTASVAGAMVDGGAEVHVWCRGELTRPGVEPSGVVVHRVAGRFGSAGLARLGRELDGFPGPRKILIQYSPPAFGWKAMNLPFAAWVLSRRIRRRDDIRVMFHEVAYPWVRSPLRHNLIAVANRAMAALLVRACSQAYVSIPGWLPLLRRVGSGRLSLTWSPIPSNVPDEALPPNVTRRRAEVTGHCPGVPVVGHFGTYGPLITRTLGPVLRDLLGRRADTRVLLLGAGGDRWRRDLIGERADWSERVVAPGSLPAPVIAEYLRACDLVIQPYPDGISSRRTTVMAALANGVPVVTTIGPLSEPLWTDGPVAAAGPEDIARLADLAGSLLDQPTTRLELGRAGRKLYEERFAIGRTVDILLRESPGVDPALHEAIP